jgi:hypothetical protein
VTAESAARAQDRCTLKDGAYPMQIFRHRFAGVAFIVAANLMLASCMTSSVAPSIAASDVASAHATAPWAEPTHARDVPPVVAEALAALAAHGDKVRHRDKIGVVDFSLPSSEPRFFLVDVASGAIEERWLVSHGSGSDPAGTGRVQRFSNQVDSNASSRGAYLTANEYVGKHGVSQRLVGLDPENDNALERAIVIHGADYVDPSLIASQGRIGRSQGCFAFERSEVRTVMARLGAGRLIYAGGAA